MSILTDNKSLALQAFEAFNRVPKKEEAIKHYLNAVQQTALKMETQGLRRCMLYVTAQMGKWEQAETTSERESSFSITKAYDLLYGHLAQLAELPQEQFQYAVLKKMSEGEIVRLTAHASFFLLCLKRLASAPATANL